MVLIRAPIPARSVRWAGFGFDWQCDGHRHSMVPQGVGSQRYAPAGLYEAGKDGDDEHGSAKMF
jgi:hypothetical protein